MANSKTKAAGKISDSFKKEYEEVMQNVETPAFLKEKQWREKGDFFEKFSLYENYTPVKTSDSTTLISEI